MKRANTRCDNRSHIVNFNKLVFGRFNNSLQLSEVGRETGSRRLTNFSNT